MAIVVPNQNKDQWLGEHVKAFHGRKITKKKWIHHHHP